MIAHADARLCPPETAAYVDEGPREDDLWKGFFQLALICRLKGDHNVLGLQEASDMRRFGQRQVVTDQPTL